MDYMLLSLLMAMNAFCKSFTLDCCESVVASLILFVM